MFSEKKKTKTNNVHKKQSNLLSRFTRKLHRMYSLNNDCWPKFPSLNQINRSITQKQKRS